MKRPFELGSQKILSVNQVQSSDKKHCSAWMYGTDLKLACSITWLSLSFRMINILFWKDSSCQIIMEIMTQITKIASSPLPSPGKAILV
jgi:hypothetical protein